MAQPGSKARVHPSRRHNNPMLYKSGKPRLRGLTVPRLADLLDKTQRKKDKEKIIREMRRKGLINIKKNHPEIL